MPRKTTAKKFLKDLAPTIASYQSKLSDEAKGMVHQDLQALFETHPEVDGIRWLQCLPYSCGRDDVMHSAETCIDDVQYRLNSHVSTRSVPYADPTLFESGFDRSDSEWVSPWNDRRIENPVLLDSLTILEEKLFDYEKQLTMAFGDQVRVTVTRKELTLEEVTEKDSYA